MALQTANNLTTPSAQMVGNAFVEQYYHILHTSPEVVYRFYQDTSLLSRPDANNVMTSVGTMQGINEKILSLNFKDYKAEIKTADAQKSHNEGVTVLVTGCLTGKDNLRRKFAQSFFLAPQDNGYFVLNDVFRYVDDGEPLENHEVDSAESTPAVPLVPDLGSTHAPEPSAPDPTPSVVEEDKTVAEKANKQLDHEKELVNVKEVVVESLSHSNGNDISVVVESTSSADQEDAPKKSYASIVKVAKGSPSPTKVYVPTKTTKLAPKKTENQSAGAILPIPELEAPTPSNNDAAETSHAQDEVKGHSIYVRNLPFNATVAQLETEFSKFGPIKPDGVQIRYNAQQGYSFGFIEFQSLSSMNTALKSAPITIEGRQVVVEIKRTTSRVGSGRGRFPSGRGGGRFRSDSFRGRGNNGGGRGYGRNEFGNWSEFSGRGRISSSRGGERGGRSGGGKPIASST